MEQEFEQLVKVYEEQQKQAKKLRYNTKLKIKCGNHR